MSFCFGCVHAEGRVNFILVHTLVVVIQLKFIDVTVNYEESVARVLREG